MSFQAFRCGDGEHRVTFEPSNACIVSWGAPGPVDIDVRVQIADGRRSGWLPYVRREPWRSCSSYDELARIEVDTVRGILPLTAIEIRTTGVEALYVATPPHGFAQSQTVRALTRVAIPCELVVPATSQYVDDESGWCAAASLTMIMNYWARRTQEPTYLADLRSTAAGIYDDAYGGTGNWSFGTAYAHSRGFFAAVAYIADFDYAQRFILAGIPLIISICWEDGELRGGPLPRSDGHLLVLRGFDREGYALVNDPALPEIVSRYCRDELEALWKRAEGMCYVVAPRAHTEALTLLAAS
jgi:hypothetical protein